MGGVRARRSPTTIFRSRLALPELLLTVIRDPVVAPGVRPSGDDAGCRIEMEPFRQALGLVGERTFAGGGDREEERTARPHAHHLRAVDPRPGRGLGREDERWLVEPLDLRPAPS